MCWELTAGMCAWFYKVLPSIYAQSCSMHNQAGQYCTSILSNLTVHPRPVQESWINMSVSRSWDVEPCCASLSSCRKDGWRFAFVCVCSFACASKMVETKKRGKSATEQARSGLQWVNVCLRTVRAWFQTSLISGFILRLKLRMWHWFGKQDEL